MVLGTFLQYRLNMLLVIAGQLFNTLSTFLGLYFLFERFGNIDGWTFGEVAMCYGITITAFAFTECFARGFDVFSGFIRQGTFDRILLRPRSTVLQILGSNVEITRIGRIAVSAAVLAYAIGEIGVTWSAMRIFTVAMMIVSGVFVFAGVFMLGATVCFWTVDGLEFINIFTNGGKELAAYPLVIYPQRVIQFFTFVIPYGAFNYLPLMYVTGRSDNALYALSTLLFVPFIAVCLIAWRIGVRHYVSTGN
jgi:ABC-2 type transport system permease protein